VADGVDEQLARKRSKSRIVCRHADRDVIDELAKSLVPTFSTDGKLSSLFGTLQVASVYTGAGAPPRPARAGAFRWVLYQSSAQIEWSFSGNPSRR
jgi:hypothetical protein